MRLSRMIGPVVPEASIRAARHLLGEGSAGRGDYASVSRVSLCGYHGFLAHFRQTAALDCPCPSVADLDVAPLFCLWVR